MASLDIPTCPPLDGTVDVLPGFLDFHARHNPSKPMWRFPPLEPQPDVVTYSQFADATHRIAHAVRPGRTGTERVVVAIFVHCDTLFYYALMIGIIRSGFIPFPMSPRNSAPAVVNMLQRTQCHRIISQPSFTPVMDSIRSALPSDYTLQVDDLPAFADVFPMFSSSSVLISSESDIVLAPYPSPVQSLAPSEVVLILHSSGSTGFPKPIMQTGITILHWCSTPVMVESRNRALRWASPSLPPFHTMGIIIQLYVGLVSGQPVSLYTPRAHLGSPPVVPTPDNALDAVKQTNANAVPAVPIFLEAWAHNDEHIKYLASLEIVAYAGGSPSEKNGNKLSKAGVFLASVYGGTEFGPPSALFDVGPAATYNPAGKSWEDWQWMQFDDRCKIRWLPQGDGSYELVFMSCATHQPSVENLPNGEKGYASSDLWEPHPTKSGLWRIVGRTDDVIVLSNGEKIVPIQQEGHIGAHPWIAGAVMFGFGHEQPGVLIEPRPGHEIKMGDQDALVEFRGLIWPQVEEANKPAPGFAQLFKEMIIVTDSARPLPRAAKGTVMRKMALALYESDINSLYQAVSESTGLHNIVPPQSWTTLHIEAWLVKHATDIHGGKVVSVDKDLFEQGFDSLSATILRNRLIGGLRSSTDPRSATAAKKLRANIVFEHPSISALTQFLFGLINQANFELQKQSPTADIDQLIHQYSIQPGMSAISATAKAVSKNGAVILVTGTTGRLGTHLLASLLEDTRIAHVYALNRGSSLLERQQASFDSAHLPSAALSGPKLTLISGDLGQDNFGLTSARCEEIKKSVTHVVHNAWRVDFNLSLASFESSISAATRLAQLVPGARFCFTSSVSAAQGWPTAKGPVPEEALHNAMVAVGSGYGMGKYVVEEVLDKARGLGLNVTILRIGQLCGSSRSGMWNTTEWVPVLVKSSITLGCLPQLDGAVSWLPIDKAALAAIEIVLQEHKEHNIPVLNLVHPHPTTARAVFSAITSALKLDLPIVSFPKWLEKIEEHAKNPTPQLLQEIPAIKLLEFFRSIVVHGSDTSENINTEIGGMALFDSAKAMAVSTTLRELPVIRNTDCEAWVRCWQDQHFIVSG
ncbi:uncharacterized protein FIBRA_05547 [Fibroporia radiculosa]|uniref:Polyketide synthase-like phosphopantetheine-binding domain-containing protein n=1 Tax=Fibroporia radiculosa TaxID=599839 RepID=J4IAS4_9APHY|nr:uncharacterized protein FIBRA_05547 [Fibroporia radiculosa]CCM03416.1 predicted protein [Fibroporia radiculosa]